MADNATQEKDTVRLTVEQVCQKAIPIFAEADKAEDSVEKQNKRWLAYAQDVVAPHLGAVYDNREAMSKFRFSFYSAYCDAMGKWKPAAPAKTCAEDFAHYNNLKTAAKDSHPTSNSIKAAINRAKVYLSRVVNYTRDILEKKDGETRGGTRPITELFVETLEKLLKQSDKLIEKVSLGPIAAQNLKSLRDSAALLKTAGFGK